MILVKTLCYVLAGSVSASYEHAVPGLIDTVEKELRIFQTVAIMEVGLEYCNPKQSSCD